jgi:putative addiction module antidote
MVLEFKLRKVGNSVGVVLPKEVLAHLKVSEGDTVCVTKAAGDSLCSWLEPQRNADKQSW